MAVPKLNVHGSTMNAQDKPTARSPRPAVMIMTPAFKVLAKLHVKGSIGYAKETNETYFYKYLV